MIRLQAQWWREAGWVLSPGEHWPSLQTLHCTPHQHGHVSAHLHTSNAPVAQFTPPDLVFSAPTRWPSKVLDQKPSPGLRKPCSLLLAARYFSCSCLTTKIVSVVPLPGTKPNWETSIDTGWSDEAIHNPLLDFHDLLSQLETAVIAPFQCISLSLIEPSWMIAAVRSQIMEAPMSPAASIISTTMPDGPSALPAFICEIAFLTISMGLPLVVDKIGGLGPSQTQHWEAFGSSLTRPSALSLCSLTALLHHSSLVCLKT